ncbi:Type I restriction enzyme EcoR124II R protein [Anaerostipes hadrus]|uniref:Type I restriction enzyme endonuclease subunit n=1 Tax=Anaerostipes hadrus TaxID=649756 RepID=A0A174JGI7_ANAHA|nr:type I restriction endonuclease subunit R [Anaerostipes hadrus]CUO96748.1 Type I restriction enzyme EcoR124II R protein [Anaerostipes hadrus]
MAVDTTKSTYNILASSDDATVVSEYIPSASKSDQYQSEADLENEFIALLQRQGYDYLQIHQESDLILNLRRQLEKLNDITFTDNEWNGFFKNILANPNDGIVEKTRMIQQDNVQVLKRDDGTSKNITLIDKKKIHNNYVQVINQYVNNDGNYDNRYDVTILVNGFPMVHSELKRRGVAIREAFNQIDRYQRDSFWASSGLYEYVQIFIVSNGTHTKYYSNTTRESRIKEANSSRGSSKKTSNSFEFTSYWADANNKPIMDLIDFTHTFLAKRTILNILTRYCVFTTEELLLVMRPYQIVATERILQRINLATNYKYDGSIKGGGYIWHTTGSGKTLTSFKTAQLVSALPEIDKVLFVVDRKDLDYQTMREYDRFEKGSADGNTSTNVLERQLSDKDKDGNPHEYKIIITTIQKLTNFVSRNAGHKIANKKVVIIFDECHRSQFGEMHQKITKFFKHYYLFGFTGTPIFAENANRSANPKYATTPQLFGDKLHTYTIVDAINDENVLPFRIDYVNTIKRKDGVDEKIEAIDTESALGNGKRIKQVVSYVLDNYDRKTKQTASYVIKGKHVKGFNSIFACQSVEMAIAYYNEFKKQIADKKSNLTIATIYSFTANEANDVYAASGMMDDEDMDTSSMDASSRDALESAIMDYNIKFHTNFDTSAAKFQNYYKDLSQRVKNREVDILIVVNMFLTGFDATTLSTLWVDKNLKMHGLIQAFSRTNRILNSIKTYGNIVCFRNLQEEVDKAISLFGDKDAESIVLLKSYDDYYNGYEEDDGKFHKGYKGLVEEIESKFPISTQIVGEEKEKEFISLYGSLLRVTNILNAFDKFESERLLSDRDVQDYQSVYIDLYDKWRPKEKQKEDISDDLVFEMELVKQVEVNIDYILALVAKYHDDNSLDAEAVARILKAVDSSTQLRSKKELIEAFLRIVNVDTDVNEDWHTFVDVEMEADIQKIIDEEKLKPEQTRAYIAKSFDFGSLKTNGTVIDDIMPPVSRFGGGRAKKKIGVIEKLKGFFEKYIGLI